MIFGRQKKKEPNKKNLLDKENKEISEEYGNNKLITISTPDSPEAENFRIIRSKILFPLKDKSIKTIMISSALPNEGKTFVAANLAVSIATGTDKDVFLIDCDLRRPSIYKIFGVSNKYGLHEILTGEKELSDTIIRVKPNNLAILPTGEKSDNPAELISSMKMKLLLDEIRGQYNDPYVVLDTNPSYILSDCNILANYVDGIIFVIMALKTPKNLVKEAVDNLGNKEKIIGVVFNGSNKGLKGHYGKTYEDYK